MMARVVVAVREERDEHMFCNLFKSESIYKHLLGVKERCFPPIRMLVSVLG